MWGHNGGKYKGFCLEFSIDHRPFSQAHRVKYVDRFPNAPVIPYLTGSVLDAANAAEDIFLIKSKSWAYEKEWRIIHKNVGTLYHYDLQSLNGIFFGPEITGEALEIIALILLGQKPNVKLFRGERSKTDFKVVFTEIGYLTNIEAISRGLL